jgi:hypothetical protein
MAVANSLRVVLVHSLFLQNLQGHHRLSPMSIGLLAWADPSLTSSALSRGEQLTHRRMEVGPLGRTEIVLDVE